MAEWLNKNAYDILCGWLQRVCGLTVPEQRKQRLIGAVRSRLTELSLDVPDAYCRYLSSLADPCDEVRRLACQLTVGETYFLRNKDHWRALATCVLPWLMEHQGTRAEKRLRLWSAGCSTGEEAYTLAISLLQVLDNPTDWQLEVLGTDLNPAAIAAAREAIYKPTSFRSVPEHVVARHFERVGTDQYRPKPELRRIVRFQVLNLLDVDEMTRVAKTDVVFCRNVLIYFDAASRKAALRLIHNRLRLGGHLFLGHSEHLHDDSFGFARTNVCNTFFYMSFPMEPAAKFTVQSDPAPQEAVRRVALSDRQVCADPSHVPRVASVIDCVRTPAVSATSHALDSQTKTLDALRQQATEQLGQQQTDAAQQSFERVLSIEPADLASHIGLALCLSGTGSLETALEHGHRALELDSLSAEAHGALAVVYEAVGDDVAARTHFEQAIYLDETFAMAHLRLAWLEQRNERVVQAIRHFQNALTSLSVDNIQRIGTFSGGFDAATIARICEAQIESLRKPSHALACQLN